MPMPRKQREQATRRDIDRAEIRGFVLGAWFAAVTFICFF